MEGSHFDHLARSVARSGSRRQVLGALLAGVLGGLRIRPAAADDDGPEIASAGNGGVATASAKGGAIAISDVNSGGNAGTAIGVGDTVGSVGVDGGTVGNVTDFGVTADGGTGIADASGGDGNQARIIDPAPRDRDRDRDRDHDNDNNDDDKDPDDAGSVVCRASACGDTFFRECDAAGRVARVCFNPPGKDQFCLCTPDKLCELAFCPGAPDPDNEVCQGGLTIRETNCCSCTNA